MKSQWNDTEASLLASDPLAMRVYTSRLIGREPSLVLHGGGNTSVKAGKTDLFGRSHEVLYVKGSGWDLATIEARGFSPVRMDTLLALAELPTLTDTDMVREQRAAMLDPDAPTPSIEAILHALIPLRYVDHTHADAAIAVCNTPDGEARIRDLYEDRVLVVPYVMPGFVLAKKVAEVARGRDWRKYQGMILMNHGVFSFADDARESYERMIELVSIAEGHVQARTSVHFDGAPCADPAEAPLSHADALALAGLRREVSREMGSPAIALLNRSPRACAHAASADDGPGYRGPLTPDHVIHTKRVAMRFTGDARADLARFGIAYDAYFARGATPLHKRLDRAPRVALWPGHGFVAFGGDVKRARVVADVTRHTIRAIAAAEGLGGWCALGEQDLFDVEYWELEQAKLRKGGSRPELQGKVALVTGAASGIGRACAAMLRARGACVAEIDRDPSIGARAHGPDSLSFIADLTVDAQVKAAVHATVERWGGLDLVVSNAGTFPKSASIASMDDALWDASIAVNLTSHRRLLTAAAPFLVRGIDASVVIIGSKNVPAPGPGQAAYSAAKAALTQLARVAALELGKDGVRVNVVHPDAVFDTGIWSPEVLAERASRYGLTIEQYKTRNVLAAEVSSDHVARMVCAMAGEAFARTTGAQVPVDGGNERVI